MLGSDLPRAGLLDRVRECDVLDRLVAGVRAGQSRVLVLRGEAGVGKTALLEHLSAAADGCRVVRAAGVESEMELAFAGLHQILYPVLGLLEVLPTPQRRALEVAFGIASGPEPDAFRVALAAYQLVCDAAEECPLVILADDAHWLDRSTLGVLTFIARRLDSEPVALVVSVRTGFATPWGDAGLSTLELDRLEEDVAKARERVVSDVARLRSPTAFEEFKGDVSQTFSDTAQRAVADLKNRAAANPAAVLAITAGLLWRFARRPPIASLLVGVGLASLLRTSSDSPPSPVVTCLFG